MQLDLFEAPPDGATDADAGLDSDAVRVPPDRGGQLALRNELERRSGMHVELVVTDNSSTMMSVKHIRRGAVARLRVHRMFVGAPSPVVAALASWITLRRNKRAAEVLNHFIREQHHQIRQAVPRTERVRTRGEHFDLDTLYREVNAAHFENQVTARITWGRYPPVARRRSITFGSYSQQDHLVRINPLLDRAFVPKYFIGFIVFHEMLHAHLGIDECQDGRRRVHSREFRAIERAHPDYARVIAWQDANLKRFLRHTPF